MKTPFSHSLHKSNMYLSTTEHRPSDGRSGKKAESQHSPFLGGFLVELSCPLTSCNRFSSSRFFSKASSSFVFPTGFLIARRKGQRTHYSIILPLVTKNCQVSFHIPNYEAAHNPVWPVTHTTQILTIGFPGFLPKAG